MAEHRWTLVAVLEVGDLVSDLSDTKAIYKRMQELAVEPVEVRGPICQDCRLLWSDWQVGELPACPGVDPLRGPLLKPEARPLSRQARRQMLRKIANAEARQRR